MWTLDPLSSMADVLDSMTDGRWWSVNDLVDDTGRTRRSILGVSGTLVSNGLVDRRPMPDGKKKEIEIRITSLGRTWLWACEQKLPPKELEYTMGLLELLAATGPVLTTVLYARKDLKETKTRNVLRLLRDLDLVEWSATRAMVWHIGITDQGTSLLRTWSDREGH